MRRRVRYLWTEDSGAGLHFWNLANEYLFQNELQIETKGNNQGILDAVRKLNLLLDITCLEHIILSFSKLIEWTGSGNQRAVRLRKEI